MKKNIWLFIILLIVGVIAWWAMQHYKGTTIEDELSDFAVDDTSSITKIFMADREGHTVTLKRKDVNTWTVNDKYMARPDAITLLLETLKQVEVRSPVGKNSYNNILKRIAAKGVKVEIYQHNNLTKTIYVGGPSQDQLGTFMYIEHSSVPFVTHIPGFNGYLTPRFFINNGEWRDRRLFVADTKTITRVDVQSKENLESSYRIEKHNDATYTVTDINTSAAYAGSADKINQYFDMLPKMAFEIVATDLPPARFDSLINAGWFRKINVDTKGAPALNIEMYKMPFNDRSKQIVEEGHDLPLHDRDRFYARVNNEAEMVVAQYILFDKIFRKSGEFQQR